MPRLQKLYLTLRITLVIALLLTWTLSLLFPFHLGAAYRIEADHGSLFVGRQISIPNASFDPHDNELDYFFHNTQDWMGAADWGVGTRLVENPTLPQALSSTGIKLPIWIIFLCPLASLTLQALILLQPKPSLTGKLARTLILSLAATFALAAIALTIITIRSYWRADHFIYEFDDPLYGAVHHNIILNHGKISYQYDELNFERSGFETNPWSCNEFPASSARTNLKNGPRDFQFLGFGYFTERRFSPVGVIPLWFPIASFSLLSFLIFQKRLRKNRANLCPTCNYDLRAHAPNQTCPECGTPIPAKPAIIPQHRSPQ